jgi:predicted AAA+ superfamily ATPase
VPFALPISGFWYVKLRSQPADFRWLTPQIAGRYATYLDTVFLTTEVLPWSTNLSSRLSKTPEIFLTDTGLAAPSSTPS